jgi:TPR repeat protein
MEEAVQLYQQAAQAGDALGMSQLARLLEQGKGVAEDRLGALKLYRQAAAAGDAVALNGMGGFYERGDVVAQDLAEAARLYVQSAEGGDAFGAANAARCFQLGIGVKQSSKEAEQWARAAAEKGIRGETLQAETDAAEMANLPRPLLVHPRCRLRAGLAKRHRGGGGRAVRRRGTDRGADRAFPSCGVARVLQVSQCALGNSSRCSRREWRGGCCMSC